MTICIAAICEGGKDVVVAVDRMFTVGPPLNVEFEPPVSKIDRIGPTCVALASGNSLYANEVISRGRLKLGPAPCAPVIQVASTVKEEYALFRDEKIEETLVRASFGLDFESFRAKGGTLPAYLQPQPMIYGQMVVRADQFNLTLDLIIAGTDTSTGHIFSVAHPGTLYNFDKLGYNAIGSGAVHAVIALSLGRQTPQSSLENTLFSVYSAKRSAEVAPGVGKETEMAVISSGEIQMCSDALMGALEKIYNERGQVQQAPPELGDVRKVYDRQREAGAVH